VVRGNDNRVIISEEFRREIHAFEIKAVFAHFREARKVGVAIVDASALPLKKFYNSQAR
jgi:hypothetical protein